MQQVLSRDEVIQLYMHFVMNPAYSKVLVEKTDDYFHYENFHDILKEVPCYDIGDNGLQRNS
jgi:hypothetical protein